MKSFLLDAFRYNRWAFELQTEYLPKMETPQKALELQSHLINAKKRWKQRLNFPLPITQDAFLPVYGWSELLSQWSEVCHWWEQKIENQEPLTAQVRFIMPDQSQALIGFEQICIQLIFHDVHHRAQIQMMLREQGVEPPVLDYFRTVLKPLS